MKLTEFIGITSRNMHVKFGAVWRSFNFWQKNADSARTLEKGWNFDISQSSPKFMKLTEFIGITSRNMHVKFEAVWRSFNFWQKMPTAPDLRKRMNFDIFSKFSKMKLTEFIGHLQEHACEIWRSLEKFQFLTEKCRATLEKGWTFDIFSKFSKIHETYRIYWNHLQEHACEIWSSLEKFQFLTEKCRQRRTLEKGWNFDIFSKFSEIHETYRIYWKFMKLTSRNMHVKFGAVWKSFNFWQKNADSAGP